MARHWLSPNCQKFRKQSSSIVSRIGHKVSTVNPQQQR